MKFKIILILLAATGWCQAQSKANLNSSSQADNTSLSERTVTWKSFAYIDQLTNTRVEVVNTFIIHNSKTIHWIQSDENGNQVLHIKNMDVQWNRLEEDGFIEYSFDYGSAEGRIRIQRQDSKLTLALGMTGLPSGPFSILFEIDKATYLNSGKSDL